MTTPLSQRPVLCITTTKPSAALNPGSNGGGGSMTLVDPSTGSIGASFRPSTDLSGKVALGVSSLATFPSTLGNGSSTQLALLYGHTAKNTEDSHAMLVSLRSSPAMPPILHWKGRLPEGYLTAGLQVSPCGHFIVGGSHSGTLYIWNSIGGRLIQSTKAHYRAIQVLTWMPCGRFLATGGADGMVHVFALTDLVAYQSSSNTTDTLKPIRTWPNHHLPVHDICVLPGNRLATAGQDGQVLILEVSSEKVIATIQMPHAIQCLTVTNGQGTTLWAGSVSGAIYSVCLDQYASYHMTQQQGVLTTQANQKVPPTVADQVMGRDQGSLQDSSDSAPAYRTELIGHERAVTSLCVTTVASNDGGHEQVLLCSGNEMGEIRIWDVRSKACLRTLYPFGSKSESAHPISSISSVPLPLEEKSSLFSTSSDNHANKKRSQTSIANLITPLQKFVESPGPVVSVPLLSSRTPTSSVASISHYFDVSNDPKRDEMIQQRLRKRPRENDFEPKERIQELESELAQAKATIERWQAVNNKLMARLQGSS